MFPSFPVKVHDLRAFHPKSLTVTESLFHLATYCANLSLRRRVPVVVKLIWVHIDVTCGSRLLCTQDFKWGTFYFYPRLRTYALKVLHEGGCCVVEVSYIVSLLRK